MIHFNLQAEQTPQVSKAKDQTEQFCEAGDLAKAPFKIEAKIKSKVWYKNFILNTINYSDLQAEEQASEVRGLAVDLNKEVSKGMKQTEQPGQSKDLPEASTKIGTIIVLGGVHTCFGVAREDKSVEFQILAKRI